MNEFEAIKAYGSDPFEWNLDRYAYLVTEIERGYGMGIDEYTNDLSCRSVLQERLDMGHSPDAASSERLRHLDERLRAVLVTTKGPIHGHYSAHYFWFYGVPCNTDGLVEDMKCIGLLE